MIKLPGLGFGSAPIGNLYRPISSADAAATIHAALASGMSLLDTAPLYGLGLAEERLGQALRDVPRGDYLLATKVGRLLNAERSAFVYDFSYDGVMRSLEGSMSRLGVDFVDILHIHEADPDSDQVAALAEAFPTLLELRDQGVIGAIGAGMNEWPALATMVQSGNYPFDLFLLAGRYTLLEQSALDFLRLCQAKGIAILAAGVFNSGILATGAGPGAKYDYLDPAPEIMARTRKIEAVCARFDVPLYAAALRFAAAQPAINCLVLGAESPAEIEQNMRGLALEIPNAFWQALRAAGLLNVDAPVG